MSFIKKLIGITFLVSVVYLNSPIEAEADQGRHNWCPEANLSDAQKESIQTAKQQLKQNILDTILESDEQRAALSACWEKKKERKKKRRNWCPEANLSDAQKESIREMRRNFKAQVKDLSEEDRKQAKQEFRQNILNTVLESDEQRAALSACWEKKKERKKKGHNWCPEANLSDAQKESIQAAKQEFRQNILNTVLENDEQKAALSACWEKRKRHKRKRQSD